MWALEREHLTPDIVTVGKGIGSGISVSAILSSSSLLNSGIEKGDLGSTYGGNPLSCSAVISVLEIMEKDRIIENVKEMEKIFAGSLRNLVEKSRYVGDVRGRGLVWGVELVEDKKTKEPSVAKNKAAHRYLRTKRFVGRQRRCFRQRSENCAPSCDQQGAGFGKPRNIRQVRIIVIKEVSYV